jgi:hypothetical protein
MFIAVPLQQWLLERVSMLRYTDVADLVYFEENCDVSFMR